MADIEDTAAQTERSLTAVNEQLRRQIDPVARERDEQAATLERHRIALADALGLGHDRTMDTLLVDARDTRWALRKAWDDLAQWRACYGESALPDHLAEVQRLRAAASKFDERLSDVQAEHRKSSDSWERTAARLTRERDQARREERASTSTADLMLDHITDALGLPSDVSLPDALAAVDQEAQRLDALRAAALSAVSLLPSVSDETLIERLAELRTEALALSETGKTQRQRIAALESDLSQAWAVYHDDVGARNQRIAALESERDRLQSIVNHVVEHTYRAERGHNPIMPTVLRGLIEDWAQRWRPVSTDPTPAAADAELPGMWEQADLSGGWADSGSAPAADDNRCMATVSNDDVIGRRPVRCTMDAGHDGDEHVNGSYIWSAPAGFAAPLAAPGMVSRDRMVRQVAEELAFALATGRNRDDAGYNVLTVAGRLVDSWAIPAAPAVPGETPRAGDRQPAYDAVTALIGQWREEGHSDVHENARIWRCVEAALNAFDAASSSGVDRKEDEQHG